MSKTICTSVWMLSGGAALAGSATSIAANANTTHSER
jgi:hypothetical protein